MLLEALSVRHGASSEAVQVGASPNGRRAVVTTKDHNTLDAPAINNRGVPSAAPVLRPSATPTPFGFTFYCSGNLIDSEATQNVVTAYRLARTGMLTPIGAPVPNGQVAFAGSGSSPRSAHECHNAAGVGLTAVVSETVGNNGTKAGRKPLFSRCRRRRNSSRSSGCSPSDAPH